MLKSWVSIDGIRQLEMLRCLQDNSKSITSLRKESLLSKIDCYQRHLKRTSQLLIASEAKSK